MQIEDESVESDSTSTVENTDSQSESTEAVQQDAAPAKQEEQVPFHEHPRFKELIEERRAFKEQLDQMRGYNEALQKQMEGLRTAQPKSVNEPKYKQLVNELEGYNPAFAKSYEELITKQEQMEKRLEEAAQIRQELEQYKQAEFQSKANSRLESLLTSNKITGKTKDRYEREIRALAMQEEIQGKKLSLQDVDRLFNSVHTDLNAYVEELKRDTLKGYVKEKKQDAAPAPTTGGAPATSGAKKLPSLDTEDGMAAAIQWFAKERRAARKV